MSIQHKRIIIIGGGPAGLIAAQELIQTGAQVDLFDAMPSVGRKFLQAGKGGMNLTHSDPFDIFVGRYRQREEQICPLLHRFDATALRQWAHDLGFETFVGSSGRVFPTDMRAAPLLRTWLQKLKESGVRFHMRHRWIGWTDSQTLQFETPTDTVTYQADAVLLALGGGSWPHLGSDGKWIPTLSDQDVEIAPLKAANCGFECDWSEAFKAQFAGTPVKTVIGQFTNAQGLSTERQGEFVITERGIEGSLIYVFAADLRDQLIEQGHVALTLDLLPTKSEAEIRTILKNRGSKSLSSQLKGKLHIDGVKAGLLKECLSKEQFLDPDALAKAIKSFQLPLQRTTPMEEAISTAGGICFNELTPELMLKKCPGIFCAGEMLDWEAPTGGYLLTGCFASGVVAADGIRAWLDTQK